MAFYLIHLIESALLVLNALAILNERRFLRKYGLDRPAFGEGVKQQAAILLYAVRTYLRFPLVLLNIFTIAFEVALG